MSAEPDVTPGQGPLNRYERAPMTQQERRVARRQVTFEMGQWFDKAREHAEQYPCPHPPMGCGAPVGFTCHVIGAPDRELYGMPAHVKRMQSAGDLPTVSKVGTGERRPTDRDPNAPIPAVNRERDSGAVREPVADGWAGHEHLPEPPDDDQHELPTD